jgi:DNA polymerase-1
MVIDVETTGLNPYRDEVFAYATCDVEGNCDVRRLDGKDGSDPEVQKHFLQNFLSDLSIAKIGHNIKFDYSILRTNGFDFPEESELHDTMMMSRILRNLNPSHDLGYLAWELLGEVSLPDGTVWTKEDDDRISKMGRAYGYHNIPVNQMYSYQLSDVIRTMLLFQTWKYEFYNPIFHRWSKDYQTEMDLIKTTERIERFGVDIHIENCNSLIDWMGKEMTAVTKETHKLFGEYLNWNGDKQVSRILFRRLGMPVLAYTDKSNEPSTDKDVLLALRETHPHPVFDLIFKYRSYSMGIAHVKKYIQFAGRNGIAHPITNTNQARTGRQSSNKPNVHNISKEAALKNPFPVPARRCFTVRPGWIDLLVDYSGIQMRLIIAACGEPELIDILKENGDVHLPALEISYPDLIADPEACFAHFALRDPSLKSKLKIRVNEIGKQEAQKEMFKRLRKILRDAAKNGNFSKAFGAGLGKWALTLGLPVHIAKPRHEIYCERLSRIANFSKQMASEIKEFGYMTSPFGRKLYVPQDKAYVGANYRIQHDEAMIVKTAENRIDVLSRTVFDEKIRIKNTVHDELILAYMRSIMGNLIPNCQTIRKAMIDIPEITVPLDVEFFRTNTTWDQKKEFKLA